MKINEIIILENDAELRQRLEQEFDDEYGNPKLPQFIMLDKASVVALAVGYIKRPKWSAGMALKFAVKTRYPDFKVTYTGMTDDQIDIFKNAKPNAQDVDGQKPTDSVQDKIRSDMKRKADQPTGTVGAQIGNTNRLGTGKAKGLAKAFGNPLSGTDQSSLRKAIGSGLAKARSNFKNSDTFKVKKS
jgi:hypothetical protein